MTTTATEQERIERFVRQAEQALQNEQDKVRRWQIQKVIRDTTKRLEAMKGA